MAISRKPEADKLPISQRINQRMENPKRRQATPTDWVIKGELFLNCSCTVFCPCVVSLGSWLWMSCCGVLVSKPLLSISVLARLWWQL